MLVSQFPWRRDLTEDLWRCREAARTAAAVGGRKAEETLRELAYVLHLTRAVKESLTGMDRGARPW
jgi:hypothetical protein